MLFSKVLLTLGFGSGIASASPTGKRADSGNNLGWNFGGSQKVRGVNVGGWLVSEPFITPSLYSSLPANVVDEYTMGQTLGVDQAQQLLSAHWDSWITEGDFARIASLGFNTVRIPVGYWAWNNFGAPFVTGTQQQHLANAIGWARTHGLKVWIDLHGAPLSQNGFDNSGQRIPQPGWLGGDSKAQTLQVLSSIAEQYAQPSYNDVVVAIELINEPKMSALSGGYDAVLDYYEKGYSTVRQHSPTAVMIHDGFVPPNNWNGKLTPSDNNAQVVVMDDHYYQMFTQDLVSQTPQQHIDSVCPALASLYSGRDKWLVTGEFTAAMDDCTMWLNGRGVGARYDGTFVDPAGTGQGSSYVGDCSARNDSARWTDEFKGQTRAFLERQMDVMEQLTQGWVFWTAKTENHNAWSVFALNDLGLLPQPLTARQFGSAICGQGSS